MDYHCGSRLREFKQSLEQLSDFYGGIEMEDVSAFYDIMRQRINLVYIKEGLKMLHKSEFQVIESFLENKGWKLVNKWLLKMTNVQQPHDITRAYEIQELIFHTISKWLEEAEYEIPVETEYIINFYNSKSEATQKIIDDFRSKWAFDSYTDLDAHPRTLDQASILSSTDCNQIAQWFSERIVELQSAARWKQQDRSTRSRRPVTEEKSVPIVSETRINVSQHSESEEDDLEIIYEKGVFSPNLPTRDGPSESTTIQSHESDRENAIDLSRAEDAFAFLRSLIEKNDGATDSGNEDAEKKSRQQIDNPPESVQNNIYVIII